MYKGKGSFGQNEENKVSNVALEVYEHRRLRRLLSRQNLIYPARAERSFG